MNWKSTAAVSTVTLAATWLGFTPSPGSPITDVPSEVRDVRPAHAEDIQRQANRLHVGVRSELGYRDPTRNPFRFLTRPAPNADRIEPPTVVTAQPPPPAAELIPFTLSGMATDTVDGQLQRTAILTVGSEVVFVKEGERVGGYAVNRVDDTGVDVTAADGTIRRLPLTP